MVLNFSSPNCPVSRGLDPGINKLAAKYKDNPDVVFLGVDSNKNVTNEDLTKHITETNQPYPSQRMPVINTPTPWARR